MNLWEFTLYIIVIWAIPSGFVSGVLKKATLKVPISRSFPLEATVFTGFVIFVIGLLKLSPPDKLVLPAFIGYFLTSGLISAKFHGQFSPVKILAHPLLSIAGGILMGLFWALIFYFYLMAILIVPLTSNIGILWLLSRMTVKKVLGFEIGDGIERELAIFFLILFISSGIRWYLFKVAMNSIVNTSRFWLLSLPTVVLIGAVEIMGARAFGWYRNIESTKKIALIVAPLYISIALSIGVSLVWGMMADGV